jgi:hypothetical protein
MINQGDSKVEKSLELLNKAIGRLAEVTKGKSGQHGFDPEISGGEKHLRSVETELESLKADHLSVKRNIALVIENLDNTICNLNTEIQLFDKEL